MYAVGDSVAVDIDIIFDDAYRGRRRLGRLLPGQLLLCNGIIVLGIRSRAGFVSRAAMRL